MELWPDDVVEGWLAREVVALTRLCPRSVAICMFARCVRSLQGNHLVFNLAGRHQHPHAAFLHSTTEPYAFDTSVITIIMMHGSGSSTADTPLHGLTWSRPGSVQVGESESLVGWAGVPAAARRRLCRLELRWRSSTCRGMHTCRLKRFAFARLLLAAMRTASEPCQQGVASSSALQAHRQWRQQS